MNGTRRWNSKQKYAASSWNCASILGRYKQLFITIYLSFSLLTFFPIFLSIFADI